MDKLKIIAVVFILLLCTGAYPQSSWYAITDSVADFEYRAIQFTSPNTGYACGEYYLSNNSGALMKTTNGGLNWQRNEFRYIECIDLYFFNDMTGYMLGSCPYGGSGFYYGHIFKTTNGAATWERHDSISGGKFFKFKFFNANTGMIAGKYGQAFKTTDSGMNWISTGVFSLWGEPQFILSVDGNTWFVGDGAGLYKTTNTGANWDLTGYYPVNALFFLNYSTGIGGNQNGSIYKTIDSGNNWFLICSNNIQYLAPKDIMYINSLTGYMCGFNSGSVFKTTNGGYNWVEQQIVPYISHFYSISFINDNTGFVAGHYGRIYKTTDGGSVFVANISSEVPDKFELGQNYPNPFNQSTIFNLQCSRLGGSSTGLVKIIVYDATGREVQTLVNETLAPGTYQVRFDGSGLASGLYYYSMSIDGKQTAVKKMVMVK